MISTELMGGLGNRMFQIAALESMGQEAGFSVYYANIDANMERLSHEAEWTRHCAEYFSIFKNFDWRKNQDTAVLPNRILKIPFGYQRIIPQDNTRYIGYFQSERYFEPSREYILFLFEPSDMVRARVDAYSHLFDVPTCSIHVRRGNYITLSHIHPVLPLEYYGKLMKYFKHTHRVRRFLIFSDDMGWCKQNFDGGECVFINDVDYIEMFLMGKCRHNIIANSSFSWWGAYLNKTPGKWVFAPAVWFADNNNRANDIVPWHWKKA